jgi:hypothetical protein
VVLISQYRWQMYVSVSASRWQPDPTAQDPAVPPHVSPTNRVPAVRQYPIPVYRLIQHASPLAQGDAVHGSQYDGSGPQR